MFYEIRKITVGKKCIRLERSLPKTLEIGKHKRECFVTQKHTRQRQYVVDSCSLNILRFVILLFSATLRGELHWRDTRAAAPAAASRLLSYCQNPGVSPPLADRPGHQHTQSLATETPNGSKPLTTPNSEVASILRCSAPYRALAWLLLPYTRSPCQFTRCNTRVRWVIAGVHLG